ncbi:MAG: hypothetical protein WD048_09680 [Chitinophagales bacterium]
MNNHPYKISDFSSHLFWDTNRDMLDFEKHKSQIIYQVLEYGEMKDWKMIQEIYDKDTLKEVTTNLRQLDVVTLSFIAHYLNIDKSEFRCYKNKQSNPNFWNS